jgi:hypothetical protein
MGMFSRPKLPDPEPLPPPSPPPVPQEQARVDVPDATALRNANERASSEAARRGRNKLRIPLASALNGGTGLSLPT